jgi:hypothetical protein
LIYDFLSLIFCHFSDELVTTQYFHSVQKGLEGAIRKMSTQTK